MLLPTALLPASELVERLLNSGQQYVLTAIFPIRAMINIVVVIRVFNDTLLFVDNMVRKGYVVNVK